MSKIADEVYNELVNLFPKRTVSRIEKEIYINYKGQKLYFDFLVKELGVYVEVQGRQHTEFIPHFHGNKDNFAKQKARDNMKIAYVYENDKYCLVRFNYDESITKELVYYKINKALDGTFYE
jgi:hypothetical protein